MTGFIQITDTHIVRSGALACGRSDTADALSRAVATINAKLPSLDGIDCVIVTGDLTDHGAPEEYGHFTSIMAELERPWLAVPGNHDKREAMRAAFPHAAWMPKHGPIHWVHELGPLAIIGLDTLQEGARNGSLGSAGLTFLDRVLDELGDKPVVVATHHPWIHAGIPAMDTDNLHDGAQLMARLEAYPGLVRMISGHVHRAVVGQIGGITCQIGPATCHAVMTDHHTARDPQLVLEPGSITVHRWIETPSPGFVSDVIPIGAFSGPWPFTD